VEVLDADVLGMEDARNQVPEGIGWVGASGGKGVGWVWWGGLPVSGKVGRAAGSSTKRLQRCKQVEWRKGIERERDDVGAICKRCKKEVRKQHSGVKEIA
jgi:hypothetical protein